MKKLFFILVIALGLGTGVAVTQPQTSHYLATFFYAKPAELQIPKLGIDAKIERVGKDKTGAMDVPKNPWNVAWYDLGPIPGQPGNAVIDGHLDTATSPAVFARLSELKPDDEVRITDDRGGIKTFVVEKTVVYNDASFPLFQVFGPTAKTRLNLITCAGVFNKSVKKYNDRYVVYTDLKD